MTPCKISLEWILKIKKKDTWQNNFQVLKLEENLCYALFLLIIQQRKQKILVRNFSVAVVTILILAITIPIKRIIEKQQKSDTTLSIIAESNFSNLIDTAVIRSQQTDLNNFIDLKAKELLQTFL